MSASFLHKGIPSLVAGCLALLFLTDVMGTALKERRLQLRRGKATVVRGLVTKSGNGGDFVVRGKPGQRMTVSVKAAGNTIYILTSPSKENLTGEGSTVPADFDLTESGDYHISIVNRDGKATRYTLRVLIR